MKIDRPLPAYGEVEQVDAVGEDTVVSDEKDRVSVEAGQVATVQQRGGQPPYPHGGGRTRPPVCPRCSWHCRWL